MARSERDPSRHRGRRDRLAIRTRMIPWPAAPGAATTASCSSSARRGRRWQRAGRLCLAESRPTGCLNRWHRPQHRTAHRRADGAPASPREPSQTQCDQTSSVPWPPMVRPWIQTGVLQSSRAPRASSRARQEPASHLDERVPLQPAPDTPAAFRVAVRHRRVHEALHLQHVGPATAAEISDKAGYEKEPWLTNATEEPEPATQA